MDSHLWKLNTCLYFKNISKKYLDEICAWIQGCGYSVINCKCDELKVSINGPDRMQSFFKDTRYANLAKIPQWSCGVSNENKRVAI